MPIRDALFASIACVSALLSLCAVLIAVIRPYKDRRHLSLLSRVEACEAAWNEMEALLKRIDARDRMRAIRSGRTEQTDSSSPTKTDGKPDPVLDPQGWKKWMREHEPAHTLRHKG